VFLRNIWYVAAWDHDISRTPTGFIFLNEPVVLFRKQEGTPVALEDRCAHRRLPLSKGYLEGDNLVCGYHGVTYDCAGAGVHIPGQQTIPSWAHLKSYPVAEKYGCIWIWMGDPSQADEMSIPDFHYADNPGWGAKNRLHVQCNYQLINDNLTDLSHLGYVHVSNVGTPDVAEHGEVETSVNGNTVTVSRWTMDKPAPPTYVEAGGFSTNIDRWQISEFSPPAYFRLTFGAAPAGTEARDRLNDRKRWGFVVCQWATPETETTTHYSWAIAHDFGADRDTSTAHLFYPQMHLIVAEDVAVFEAQQRCIDLDPTAPVGIIGADAGLVEARRVNARLLAAENGDKVSQQSAQLVNAGTS
jgi:phenylpropionate dioxygenase-like ring-hydroxylating dioxygenase large terminal subunit